MEWAWKNKPETKNPFLPFTLNLIYPKLINYLNLILLVNQITTQLKLILNLVQHITSAQIHSLVHNLTQSQINKPTPYLFISLGQISQWNHNPVFFPNPLFTHKTNHHPHVFSCNTPPSPQKQPPHHYQSPPSRDATPSIAMLAIPNKQQIDPTAIILRLEAKKSSKAEIATKETQQGIQSYYLTQKAQVQKEKEIETFLSVVYI